jgi:hypothetical protein
MGHGEYGRAGDPFQQVASRDPSASIHSSTPNMNHTDVPAVLYDPQDAAGQF